MSGTLAIILAASGVVSFVVSVVIALANRGIREERIDHLSGMVDELRADLNHERDQCSRQVDELRGQVAHQQGQIDAATGELGERIGREVGRTVLTEIRDWLATVER